MPELPALASRGFLAGADLAALRQRRHTPPYDRLWARLGERTRAVARHHQAAGFPFCGGGLGWHSHAPMLPEAALLALLDEDAEMLAYLEAALQAIDQLTRQQAREGKLNTIHSFSALAIAGDVLRDRLSAASRARLLALMRELAIPFHTGASKYHGHGGGNNIVWCQSVTAAICALLWGEEAGVADWRAVVQYGIHHTRAYLRVGTDAGGFSYEGTGYGHGVYALMFTFVELLRLTGTTDLYASEPRLRQVAEATLQRVFPDGSFLTNDNDVGLQGAENLPCLLWLARVYDEPLYRGLWELYQGPDHPLRPYGDLRPVLSAAHGQTAPGVDPYSALFHAFLSWDASAPVVPVAQCQRPLASYSPGTETVNLRTSWQRDAIFVNLQGAGRSHACLTHRHADAGHFSIVAHGEYLAIDTGRYNSDEDQHSVMLVDGRCHAPIAPGWGMDWLAGEVTRWSTQPWLTHARVDAKHLKGCHWCDRDLLFVPLGDDAAYLVLVDNVNKDNARHQFVWQLQVNPAAELLLEGPDRAQVLGQRARLDLSFHWPGPADYPSQPHQFRLRQDRKEWHWPYGREANPDLAKLAKRDRQELMMQTSYLRPRLLGELDGLNGRLLTVIAPRRREQAPLKVVQRAAAHLLWVEITTPLGTDTIVAAPDHAFIEGFGEPILSELLFQRRDPAGHLSHQWSASDQRPGG